MKQKQVNVSKHGLLGVSMELLVHRLTFTRQSSNSSAHVNGTAASAGGLGGTLAFAPFVMREQDLSQARRRPPMTLIQIGLWGIPQHL